MAQIATPSGRLLHPRENLIATNTLAAVTTGTEIFCDSAGTVTVELRGTFVGTVALEGSVDGINWTTTGVLLYPFNQASIVPVLSMTAPGIFAADCSKFTKVRARMTAWTSGAANCAVVADNAMFVPPTQTDNAHVSLTSTAAVGTIVTLTIPSPGAGLRQYLTGLQISRFATALLTAAAAPVIVTTTGLVGTPSFDVPAEAAAQGTVWTRDIQFANPIPNAAQAATAVITFPATTGVIAKLTAFWRIGQ